MSGKAEIAVLDAEAARAVIDDLADILKDCVAGGASVNFMHPFSHADAKKFFEKVIPTIARGETILLGAWLDGRVVGTVQLGLDTPPNQQHRAEVKKLLVHRSARGRGIGAALMQHIEAVAKKHGRTLLTLDTASAEAERLYQHSGWQRLGVIPDYAMWPRGGFCDTVIFWKKL
ncbi:MAG TPA: GNAT family N-acetyltransferase [Pseudolabrys sp.]|nr:GNAT family N-acetyltransferase [Pseudolabrys sp.]